MRKVKVRKLTHEAFHKFGTFAPLIDPFTEEATGCKDAGCGCIFFRDMVQQDMGCAVPSYSTCRVLPRKFVVTDAEYHNHTCEVAIPLDGDAVIWFAPASAGNRFPADAVEAFYVPQGYVVNCRPGVWHHAAFAAGEKPLNVLIVLPERTYAKDCFVTALAPEEQIELEF